MFSSTFFVSERSDIKNRTIVPHVPYLDFKCIPELNIKVISTQCDTAHVFNVNFMSVIANNICP